MWLEGAWLPCCPSDQNLLGGIWRPLADSAEQLVRAALPEGADLEEARRGAMPRTFAAADKQRAAAFKRRMKNVNIEMLLYYETDDLDEAAELAYAELPEEPEEVAVESVLLAILDTFSTLLLTEASGSEEDVGGALASAGAAAGAATGLGVVCVGGVGASLLPAPVPQPSGYKRPLSSTLSPPVATPAAALALATTSTSPSYDSASSGEWSESDAGTDSYYGDGPGHDLDGWLGHDMDPPGGFLAAD